MRRFAPSLITLAMPARTDDTVFGFAAATSCTAPPGPDDVWLLMSTNSGATAPPPPPCAAVAPSADAGDACESSEHG